MSKGLKHAGILAIIIMIASVLVYADDAAKAKPAGAANAVSVIGQMAPDFSLKDTDGKTYTLHQFLDAGKTVVIHWFNPHCPFIIRHFATYPTFSDLYSTYNKRDVVFLAINSTNPDHPQYGGDADGKKKWSIPYPILLDPTGAVGKLYGAKTTPHAFIISSDGVVRYSGAIDDDPQDSKPAKAKVNYAHQVLEEILSGKPVSVAETRPYGCGVKYGQ